MWREETRMRVTRIGETRRKGRKKGLVCRRFHRIVREKGEGGGVEPRTSFLDGRARLYTTVSTSQVCTTHTYTRNLISCILEAGLYAIDSARRQLPRNLANFAAPRAALLFPPAKHHSTAYIVL